MKKFLLFISGLIALLVLVTNIGPLVLLSISVWLLYLIFKQFMKTDSTLAKVCWILLGLAILAIGISNLYAVLGIVAAFVLYLVYKHWNETDHDVSSQHHDPFMNFEQEWGEFNK